MRSRRSKGLRGILYGDVLSGSQHGRFSNGLIRYYLTRISMGGACFLVPVEQSGFVLGLLTDDAREKNEGVMEGGRVEREAECFVSGLSPCDGPRYVVDIWSMKGASCH